MSTVSQLPINRKLPHGFCIAADSLMNGARAFAVPFYIPFLESCGVSLGMFAWIKIIQCVAVFLLKVPCGIFADTFGRRLSLILGASFSVMSFGFYLATDHFSWFCIAEIFQAVSMSFWAGATEAYAVDSSDACDSPGGLDRYLHSLGAANAVSSVVFSTASCLLSATHYRRAYSYSIGLSLAVMLLVLLKFPSDERRPSFRDELKSASSHWNDVRESLGNPSLLPFFFIMAAIQFAVQPLIQYWQPLLEQNISSSSAVVSVGFVYSIGELAAGLGSMFYSRLSQKDWARSEKSTLTLFTLFSSAYFILPFLSGFWAVVIGYGALQILNATARTSFNARLNAKIIPSSRASILSTAMLVSRIGMFSSLYASNVIFTRYGRDSVSILYKVSALASLAVCLLLWSKMKKKPTSEPGLDDIARDDSLAISSLERQAS